LKINNIQMSEQIVKQNESDNLITEKIVIKKSKVIKKKVKPFIIEDNENTDKNENILIKPICEFINTIIHGNSENILMSFEPNCIDLL